MNEKKGKSSRGISASKECAYLAVTTAMLVVAQLCLSALPGVEVVTALFVAYSFAFGGKRGMAVGAAFSLLRQLVFGFFPNVLILYLLYYTSLALLFGFLGRRVKRPLAALWWLTLIACVCTLCFSLLDNIITPLWYGFTREAARAYFIGSFPVALPQVVCTAVTVGLLFIPLERAFRLVLRSSR